MHRINKAGPVISKWLPSCGYVSKLQDEVEQINYHPSSTSLIDCFPPPCIPAIADL